MDLSQLVFYRLASDKTLQKILARYDGQPAIFNTEFPSDQQGGWDGKTQYPRIEYQFNFQVDTQRASSGVLMMAVYTEKDPMVSEQIEMCVRRSLKDVLMKPDGNAPFCVAWARTEPFLLEGNAILCKELVFDILEYPDQRTTDPDPVESMSLCLKEAFPEMFVVGADQIDMFQVATEDRPIIYVRMDSYMTDHVSMALAWINCRMAVHVIAPDAESRSKWVRVLMNYLMVSGEAVMTDESPLRFTGVQAANASNYLIAGQILLSGQYTLPRYQQDAGLLRKIQIKEA